ncbi:MAG TPA: hypothetical protein VGP26_03745 [Actinophytocola sp.]|nr:hypothetical protein [Actinophytocola sp.]
MPSIDADAGASSPARVPSGTTARPPSSRTRSGTSGGPVSSTSGAVGPQRGVPTASSSCSARSLACSSAPGFGAG